METDHSEHYLWVLVKFNVLTSVESVQEVAVADLRSWEHLQLAVRGGVKRSEVKGEEFKLLNGEPSHLYP